MKKIYSLIYSEYKEYLANKKLRTVILEYGFSGKSKILQVLQFFAIIIFASLIIYLIVERLHLKKVDWSEAFMVILSLGAAIIAYQQWRENRHEISIDKYYDFLGEANERLECLDVSKIQMHVYVELDKLEYVIVKYELGFIPARFAKRAMDNFKCHCQKTNKFQSCVQKVLAESAYLEQTKKIANTICEKCATRKIKLACKAELHSLNSKIAPIT